MTLHKYFRYARALTVPASIAALTLAVALSPPAASAQENAPHGRISQAGASTLALSAQVQELVAPDVMRVTLATERSGTDLSSLNKQVLEQTNTALTTAKRAEVQANLDGVFTSPRYENGKRMGWVVRSQVALEGSDFAKVAGAASKLQSSMEMAGVTFSLSPALRNKVHTSMRQALADAFKAKAQDMSEALGFRGYKFQALALEEDNAPVFMERASPVRAMSTMAADIPTQTAKELVSLRMNGTILLTNTN